MNPEDFRTIGSFFVVGLIVLILDIIIILLQVWSLQMEREGRKPTLRTKWGATDVFLGIQAAILLMGFFQFIIGMYLAVTDYSFMRLIQNTDDVVRLIIERYPVALLFMFLSTQGALLLTALVFVRTKYQATEDVYSLRPVSFSRQLVLAGAWLVAVLGIGIIGSVAITAMMTYYEASSLVKYLQNLQESINPQEQILKLLSSTGGALAAYLLAGIVAPVCEEAFFRLFVFNVFKNRWGLWAGVLLSSLLFAIFHGPLSAIVIFPIGVCLALAYHSSGTIWTAILLHCFYNIVMVTIAIFFPRFAQ